MDTIRLIDTSIVFFIIFCSFYYEAIDEFKLENLKCNSEKMKNVEMIFFPFSGPCLFFILF